MDLSGACGYVSSHEDFLSKKWIFPAPAATFFPTRLAFNSRLAGEAEKGVN